MRFFARGQMDKADVYIDALQKARHQRVQRLEHADLVLLDYEGTERALLLEQAEQRRLPVVLVPHGGNPPIFDPGPHGYRPSAHVGSQLVAAPGHVAAWKAQDGPRRKFVVAGFPWCPQKPFRASPQVETVVFAPVHGAASGYLCPLFQQANRQAQELIRELWPEARVLVSVWGSLAQNGLAELDGWTYLSSRQLLDTTLIDRADLVVATETFACLAVARGVPTLMFEQTFADWNGVRFQNSPLVEPLWRYPHDLAGDPLRALETEAAEWRQRWIGGPFQPQVVVRACERALKRHRVGEVVK